MMEERASNIDSSRCIGSAWVVCIFGPMSLHWLPCLPSINQSKRKTSNANGQTNLGHKHKAPDHNHEATQPMVDLPHTS